MLDKKVKGVAKKIGEFFLQKNNNDYERTADEITNLHITKLEDDGDKIRITLGRPGMLIGKRGEQVDKLISYLGRKLHIIEDPDGLVDHIIPREPLPCEEYDNMYDLVQVMDDEEEKEITRKQIHTMWLNDIQDDYDYYK